MGQGNDPADRDAGVDIPPGLSEEIGEAVAAEELAAVTTDPAALDAVVAAWESITRDDRFGPAAPEFRAAVLTSWGSALQRRYWAEGALVDLDAAITAFQDALHGTPATATARPDYLINLGYGLRERYDRAQDRADLEAAITAWHEALEATPADAPERPFYLGRFGIGLRLRDDQSRAPADLDAAIAAFRTDLPRQPRERPERSL
jgi:tetratricopeptide (TPR) repeat protein